MNGYINAGIQCVSIDHEKFVKIRLTQKLGLDCCKLTIHVKKK